MRIKLLLALLCWLGVINTTAADVLAASREGFGLRVVTTTQADPLTAYLAFIDIGKWWDPDHTYFGKAGVLSLDVRPGGAFLEASASGGFVKHLEVVYANPGKEIRLLGGLGPLQPMGLHGALSVQFQPREGGGTLVTMFYNVSGFAKSGLETLAPIVDRVQTEQMQRHARYADELAGAE